MDNLLKDIRYATRMMMKRPGFTAVAVLTLGLGIGANTAIFSVVNAVLIRPLPYEDPDRLVMVRETVSARDIITSYPNFADWRDQSDLFEHICAVRPNENFNLTGAGEPERLQGRLVSSSFFSMLGAKPVRGRDFLAEEDRAGASATVILSYGFWQRRFGGDENIIGRQLTLNNQSFTVVGIAPENFRFAPEADVTVPIGLSAARFTLRGKDPGVVAVARLGPGVSREQAQAGLNTVAERLEQQYPDTNTGRRVRIETLHESIVRDSRSSLWILFGAVGFVLLIACANVANLLLARGAARQKEMAIRAALGAARLRIIRGLLTESVLLAMLGGALGLLFAGWGTAIIISYLPDGLPYIRETGLDSTVLGFTLGASLLTGVIFGLAPALQSSQINLAVGLQEGDRGSRGRRQHTRNVLVVSEIALTMVLLVAAGLLIKSFWRLHKVDPGFDSRNLLTCQVSVSAGPDEGRKVADFFERLQEKIQTLPGVESVAVSNGLPFVGANQTPFFIEGGPRPEPGKEPSGIRYTVSHDYFQTLGISLVRGRSFTARDTRDSTRVAVIDEALAREHFQNEDPIGRRLTLALPEAPSFEIVGVVGHVEHFSLDGQSAIQAQYYLSFDQIPLRAITGQVRRINVLVRTSSEPISIAPSVRDAVLSLNKDQAVFNVRTMDQILSGSVADRRFSMLLLTVFAMLALLLAAICLYGVMSYTVAQRTREIGIRMALGADKRDVLRLVVGQGLVLALVGVAIGLAAALALTRVMAGLLFGVTATDPTTFFLISVVLASVSLAACYVPARRATRVDPIIALRYE
jgi:putative ABC transport system permease protein